MDLHRARAIAEQLIAEHLDEQWSFGWDNAKSRLGVCRYDRKMITVSRHCTALNSEELFVETVLHEVAHALTPGAKHGPRWKKAAVRLGVRPAAMHQGGDLVTPPAKWRAVCPNCGKEHPRHRRPSRPVACAHCCNRYNRGLFDRRFLLRWQPGAVGEGLSSGPEVA